MADAARTCVFCDSLVTEWTTRYFYSSHGKHCRSGQCVCHDCAQKHLDYKAQYDEYDLKPARAAPPSAPAY